MCVNLEIKVWKCGKIKKQRNAYNNQMEETKRESYVLGYNVIKFNVVRLNLILKMCLNLGNITHKH